MKKFYLLIFFILFLISPIVSQDFTSKIPQVPSSFYFDKIKVEIDAKTKNEIQNEVDALHANRKYFEMVLNRIVLYFPIIEEVLKQENIPGDIIYLCVQESALIAEAESSSNALGYWQFKEETARTHGLTINKSVDERLNIISSTRAACSFLKTNNFYFDNWLYSLLSYMTGLTGAKAVTDKKKYGSKRMKINKDTHWYIKKFIAHKIAFQGELNYKNVEGLSLEEYSSIRNKSLKKISKELKVDYNLLLSYNKWSKSNMIPDNKDYPVIIPIKKGSFISSAENKFKTIVKSVLKSESEFESGIDKKIFDIAAKKVIILNGLPAIIADSSDSFRSISQSYKISVENIKNYNDLKNKEKISAGNTYYLKRKRKKGRVLTYRPRKEDSLWSISQKFGIRLENLKKLNHIQNNGLSLDKNLILRRKFFGNSDAIINYKNN